MFADANHFADINKMVSQEEGDKLSPSSKYGEYATLGLLAELLSVLKSSNSRVLGENSMLEIPTY